MPELDAMAVSCGHLAETKQTAVEDRPEGRERSSTTDDPIVVKLSRLADEAAESALDASASRLDSLAMREEG